MKYFTYEEMIYSDTALKKNIRNKTTKEIEDNIRVLVETLLDPIRIKWGKPLTVNSGYRCATLNKAIGGSNTSAHMSGLAADLDAGSPVKNKELAKLIASMGIDFDQLIDEKKYAWVHVGLTATSRPNRKQILRYDGKSYKLINASQL